MSGTNLINKADAALKRSDIPAFRVGDTVRVHAKIVEGEKERVQIFEGVVIRNKRKVSARGSFTVRKISFNVGVERTFFVHSPRIEKIELVARGEVRRAKLYYLRNLRGRAARVKSELIGASAVPVTPAAVSTTPAA